MIKAVIFDLDGTLYDYDLADRAGYASLQAYASERLGLQVPVFDRMYRETMKEVDELIAVRVAAVHDRYLRFQLLLENAHLPLVPHVWGLAGAYWDTFLDHMVMSPGLVPCLEKLRGASFTLGIGTNMTVDYQIKKLERLELAPFFDFVVSSEEVNSEKPEPKLFLRCAEKARCEPKECLFIGDNVAFDIKGALSAGMQAMWYAPKAQEEHPGIARFGHYDELAAWLLGKGAALPR